MLDTKTQSSILYKIIRRKKIQKSINRSLTNHSLPALQLDKITR